MQRRGVRRIRSKNQRGGAPGRARDETWNNREQRARWLQQLAPPEGADVRQIFRIAWRKKVGLAVVGACCPGAMLAVLFCCLGGILPANWRLGRFGEVPCFAPLPTRDSRVCLLHGAKPCKTCRANEDFLSPRNRLRAASSRDGPMTVLQARRESSQSGLGDVTMSLGDGNVPNPAGAADGTWPRKPANNN